MGLQSLLLKKVTDFIDAQVTKQLKPFLEVGTGPDGESCSDFVVDAQGDMSIENMIIKTSVANEALTQKGLPYRVSMVRAKRIAIDIPWEKMSSGEWSIEVHELMVVMHPLEKESWSLDNLRKAKEFAIRKAVSALIKKLKALDAKPKKNGILESIKRRLMDQVNLTVHIKDVHLRLERATGSGVGAPPFAVGFVLPSCDVHTALLGSGMQTTVTMGRAGVYCRAGVIGDDATVCGRAAKANPANALSVGAKGGAKSPTKAARKEERLAEAERQQAFFLEQNEIRNNMLALTEATHRWAEDQWLVHCGAAAGADGAADDGSAVGLDEVSVASAAPLFLEAKVKIDNSDKLKPSSFAYAAPLQVTSVRVGRIKLQATEAQLAALMSLTAHGADFKLWSSYGIIREQVVGKEGRAPSRLLWKAAARAVTAALAKGGKVKTSNLAQVLMEAKAYKKHYVDFLSGSGMSAQEITRAKKEVQAARAKLDADGGKAAASLQQLEDVLPIPTVAWCRVVAGQGAVSRLKRKSKTSPSRGSAAGEDEDDEAEEMSTSAQSDDMAARLNEGNEAAGDGRITEAPCGFVIRVMDVHVSCFAVHLLRSLSAVERIENGLGDGGASSRLATPSRGLELLHLSVDGIKARVRSIKGVGATTDLAITSLSAHAGPAGISDHPDAPRKPLIFQIGDPTRYSEARARVSQYESSADDELLGGPVADPGDIAEALYERRMANKSIIGRVASRTYSRAFSWPAPSTSPAAAEAEEGEEEEEGSSAARAMPAIRVHSLTSTVENEPHAIRLAVAPGQVHYAMPFWTALESFLRPIEQVKWSSQLGGTAMLRMRHVRMYRACDKLMREAFHKPQMQIMTIFTELSDVLGLPSSRHRLDVQLHGLTFTLASEKGWHDGEVMSVQLPPISVKKQPKVGNPPPPTQKLAISFGAPIEVETSMEKGVFARVAMIGLNGNTNTYKAFSRLQGSRDTLNSEVRALNAQIYALEAEKERLQMVRAGLRASALASAVDIAQPAHAAASPEYHALYGSEKLSAAVSGAPKSASADAEDMRKRLSTIEGMVKTVLERLSTRWGVAVEGGKKRGGSIFRRGSSTSKMPIVEVLQ